LGARQAARPRKGLPAWWAVPRHDLMLLSAAHRRGFYSGSRKSAAEQLLADPDGPFVQHFQARALTAVPAGAPRWAAGRAGSEA
jgi:hypothetical protein